MRVFARPAQQHILPFLEKRTRLHKGLTQQLPPVQQAPLEQVRCLKLASLLAKKSGRNVLRVLMPHSMVEGVTM